MILLKKDFVVQKKISSFKKNFLRSKKNFFNQKKKKSLIDAMDAVEQQQQQKQDSEIIMTAINPGYSFEWNELLFETTAPYIFHDTKLNLEREVIFDFWKNEFDIYKNIHFSNKNIHYFTSEGYCIPFLL